MVMDIEALAGTLSIGKNRDVQPITCNYKIPSSEKPAEASFAAGLTVLHT